MKLRALVFACGALALLSFGHARAQVAYVVPDCTVVSGMATGPNQYLVEDQTGKLCGLVPSASTPQPVTPTTATSTDKSGTVTAGGTAQTAIAANASRKGWCIQNPSTATEVLYVRIGATATAITGVQLAAGQQACNPAIVTDTALISVLAATTSHQWYGTEWQ